MRMPVDASGLAAFCCNILRGSLMLASQDDVVLSKATSF
jgi:hypothetical protein